MVLESESLRFESVIYHFFDLGQVLTTQSPIFLFYKMEKVHFIGLK